MSDTEKMTDAQFASKAEYEGVSYAMVDYGLKSSDLADKDTELHAAVVAVEELLPAWRVAMGNLEAAIEDVLTNEDET